MPPVTTSRSAPRAHTGSALLDVISNTSMSLVHAYSRIDPFLRPAFDRLLRDAVARGVTALMNAGRANEHLALAEERPLPDEDAHLQSIIDSFTAQMGLLWKPGGYERGGNTKTHGMVRGEFVVHEGLPPHLRKGVFAEPRRYQAWVRFSGPGPYWTPDIEDVGFMSISIKLLGVPGPKLMDEEQHTQDFTAVSTPTFVTQDTKANAHLQTWSVKNAQLYHFVNFTRPHVFDLLMQGLWIKTQTSPFEAPYFSGVPVPARRRPGDAVLGVADRRPSHAHSAPAAASARRLPARRDGGAGWRRKTSTLDFRVQVQTDPHLMPIENNGVLWPERLSPRVSVATLRLPKQSFDSPEQIAFARRLSYNPWHCIAEHRPLGNQSRARRRMYYELSQLRHRMNAVPHYEPTGDETFEPAP